MPESQDTAEAAPAAPASLQHLKWLVGLRLLLAAALLGSAVALDWRERLPFQTGPLYGLLGLTFGLSLAYALLLRSQRGLPLQTVAQLAVDLILVSLLVHFTGGVDSVMAFMYIFVVFAAATILRRRGSLTFAVLSGAGYAFLVLGEWTRLISPVEFAGGLAPLRSAGYAVYQVLIHAVAFLAVAILSSHLADRLRQAGQELERRRLDLRNLQTLHQAIVSNIASGLLTLDLAGRVVAFNQAAEQITGYPFAELRDRPWQNTPFAGCQALAGFFANPAAPLPRPVIELTLERRDGRRIPVGLSCSPLPGPGGEPIGLVAIFQDLTEQKRVEEQLRQADRLAALGQLAATIAHEVRNPLAAISGSVEMLGQDLAPRGPNRELLDIVLQETRRLKLITGQFLDFSKPAPLLYRACPVTLLVVETLQLLERSSERHPALRWSLTEEVPDLAVLANPDQLRQIFWNLCLNALQAMPDGGSLTVRLRLAAPDGDDRSVNSSTGQSGETDGAGASDAATRRQGDAATGPSERSSGSGRLEPLGNPPAGGPADWVEITFQDTGRGIPREELDRIFDPFYTTRPAGTGLGLSIARGLLESMGGRVAVRSEVGQGTTFRLWLRHAPARVGASGRE